MFSYRGKQPPARSRSLSETRAPSSGALRTAARAGPGPGSAARLGLPVRGGEGPGTHGRLLGSPAAAVPHLLTPPHGGTSPYLLSSSSSSSAAAPADPSRGSCPSGRASGAELAAAMAPQRPAPPAPASGMPPGGAREPARYRLFAAGGRPSAHAPPSVRRWGALPAGDERRAGGGVGRDTRAAGVGGASCLLRARAPRPSAPRAHACSPGPRA